MTQTEVIKSSLPNIDSEMIKQFLKDDAISPLKMQMEIGERYFNGKHDICYKKLNEYKIKDFKTEKGRKIYCVDSPKAVIIKVRIIRFQAIIKVRIIRFRAIVKVRIIRFRYRWKCA